MNMNDWAFLRGSAFHESAHAVVALELGIPVDHAAISLRDGGVCRYVDTRTSAFRRAVTSLAPDFCLEISPAAHTCSPTDRANVNRCISGLTRPEGARFIEAARARAKEIVDLNREPISQVASELLRCRRLSGRRIAAIRLNALRSQRDAMMTNTIARWRSEHDSKDLDLLKRYVRAGGRGVLFLSEDGRPRRRAPTKAETESFLSTAFASATPRRIEVRG